MKIYLSRDVKSPNRGTEKSAGIDFYVPNDLTMEDYMKFNKKVNFDEDIKTLSLKPNERIVIPSGVFLKVPNGFALVSFNKGGIAVKKGLIMGACVIDEDYQGEVFINMINTSNETVLIKNGDKITQMLLLNVFYDELIKIKNFDDLYEDKSKRGDGCMGSTGV